MWMMDRLQINARTRARATLFAGAAQPVVDGADTVTDAQGRSCAAPHSVQPLEQSPHGRGMDGEARADA